MKLPIYQLDAFTNQRFGGNPAAVVILTNWLPDSTLQAIAQENNLSETAFIVARSDDFELRWFTPLVEIDLCGHATLASAFVLFTHGYTTQSQVVFHYKDGTLTVKQEGDLLVMDFPARLALPIACAAKLVEALGALPEQVLQARDLLVIFATQDQIQQLQPDFTAIAKLDVFAIIVSAPGTDCDFVSRFFAPRAGITEDPVTGSAHCTLVPYWSERLNKKKLHARQLSQRQGELFCEDAGERVMIAGRVVEYLHGHIYL